MAPWRHGRRHRSCFTRRGLSSASSLHLLCVFILAVGVTATARHADVPLEQEAPPRPPLLARQHYPTSATTASDFLGRTSGNSNSSRMGGGNGHGHRRSVDDDADALRVERIRIQVAVVAAASEAVAVRLERVARAAAETLATFVNGRTTARPQGQRGKEELERKKRGKRTESKEGGKKRLGKASDGRNRGEPREVMRH